MSVVMSAARLYNTRRRLVLFRDPMLDYRAARLNMVESQLRTNKVTDEAVLDAFLAVPRERFVPDHLDGIAYVDEDIPLGGGRFLLEPMVLARLMQIAAIGPEDGVLVIGAATGYAARSSRAGRARRRGRERCGARRHRPRAACKSFSSATSRCSKAISRRAIPPARPTR